MHDSVQRSLRSIGLGIPNTINWFRYLDVIYDFILYNLDSDFSTSERRFLGATTPTEEGVRPYLDDWVKGGCNTSFKGPVMIDLGADDVLKAFVTIGGLPRGWWRKCPLRRRTPEGTTAAPQYHLPLWVLLLKLPKFPHLLQSGTA